ncbi:T9SS type A sorting domain-containing protein [Flavobacterium sp. HJ-32-4]|uniref:T9SS type A sorting domain-containing protein n=2 Tax=unclassified Flavobacterium TaxID=196869 RepID=UPI001F147385|nr:T9SS type A sorting domain-containing protein [Flavobacterium sp. HJ-32-4]UMY66917.1 T9SS type A sorting domain-containing protein [Flavobacterium sp. HJ-32-4]
MLFIVKYSPDGVMQWFKRPQPDDTPIENGLLKTRSYALAMDKATATAYWLVEIPDGPVGDGAFVNTSGFKFFILKYNAQGTLTGAIGPLDIQYNGGYIGTLHFYRNPYNGYFYMYAMKDSAAATITLGGQTTDKCFLLACFNEQGQFQWMRTDTTTNVYYSCLFDLAFDSDNSLYIAGRLSINNIDSFLGVSSNTNVNPPFVMKTDPTASTVIWSSYANKQADNCGGIALNGDEVGFAGRANASNFTWGGQVLNVNTIGEGSEALLARFNKTTGACIALTKIPGDAGYDDVGSALTVDAAGDYLFGGGIGHQMTFASGDIYNDGLQTDFFVAKYATAPCQPLGVNDNQNDGFGLYPNPVDTQLFVSSRTAARYVLVDMTGKQLAKGSLSEGENILETASLPPGVYLLKIQNQKTTTTLRVVKK